MSGHTPGPWNWEHNSASGEDHACIEIRGESKEYGEVAYLQSYKTHDYDNRKETIANACLITAAPDLLAACTQLLAVYGELHAAYDLGDCGGSIRARAAIAKATGAQP